MAKFIRTSTSVTVSRTVQTAPYTPSTISITETADVPEDMDVAEVKLALYKSCTASVTKFINNELKKYSEE